MSEPQEIVGAAALYRTPDDLVSGLSRIRELGFTRLDVVSPYPIHGIDRLLGVGPSRLGYVALVAGITAVLLAKLVQWWMSEIDYPLNIGGKPLFSWPAFVPVTFELMVLVASIVTVVGMLSVFNRLPHYGSALLQSKLMPDLTRDKFGLVVDARDPVFEGETIQSVLGGGGALEVDLLHRVTVSRFFSEQIFSIRFLLLLAAIAFSSVTATQMIWKYGGEIPPFNFMKAQQKLNPQHESASFENGIGMRAPVAGTVARGFLPYAYANDAEAATAQVNPMPLSPAALDRGRDRYDIFCRPCHGIYAEGNGTLTAAFPKAPSLHSARVRGWTDGRIYHVLTTGQNAMPAYARQIGREDRWRIIHYLRALQRSQNAPERDLP